MRPRSVAAPLPVEARLTKQPVDALQALELFRRHVVADERTEVGRLGVRGLGGVAALASPIGGWFSGLSHRVCRRRRRWCLAGAADNLPSARRHARDEPGTDVLEAVAHDVA